MQLSFLIIIMHQQVTRKVCDKCAKEHKYACNHFDSMTQAKLEDKANNHLESDTVWERKKDFREFESLN